MHCHRGLLLVCAIIWTLQIKNGKHCESLAPFLLSSLHHHLSDASWHNGTICHTRSGPSPSSLYLKFHEQNRLSTREGWSSTQTSFSCVSSRGLNVARAACLSYLWVPQPWVEIFRKKKFHLSWTRAGYFLAIALTYCSGNNSIYTILGITGDQERIKVYRRICIGYMQIPCHFIQRTWACHMWLSARCPETNPPRILGWLYYVKM